MLAEANLSARPVTDPEVKPAVLVFFAVLLLVAVTAELEELVEPCALETEDAAWFTAERVVVLSRFVFLAVVVAVAF